MANGEQTLPPKAHNIGTSVTISDGGKIPIEKDSQDAQSCPLQPASESRIKALLASHQIPIENIKVVCKGDNGAMFDVPASSYPQFTPAKTVEKAAPIPSK